MIFLSCYVSLFTKISLNTKQDAGKWPVAFISTHGQMVFLVVEQSRLYRETENSSKSPKCDQMLYKHSQLMLHLFLFLQPTPFLTLVSITMAPRIYFIHSTHYSLCLINATLKVRKVQFSISCMSL